MKKTLAALVAVFAMSSMAFAADDASSVSSSSQNTTTVKKHKKKKSKKKKSGKSHKETPTEKPMDTMSAPAAGTPPAEAPAGEQHR